TGHLGLCHVTSGGETSWHDFAREIFRLEGVAPALAAVTSADYGARAKRPAYSVLGHDTLRTLGLEEPRHWTAALAAYLAERRRPARGRAPPPGPAPRTCSSRRATSRAWRCGRSRCRSPRACRARVGPPAGPRRSCAARRRRSSRTGGDSRRG